MSDDALIGQQLDEYRLEELLGQGGMARVYRGVDVRLDRWVAIKVIDAPFRTDSEYMMRFEREARAVAQLEHPHIVSLYRYGEANGLLYMAMQYVEGAPLDSVLATYREDGELIPLEEARRVIREVSLALDYAHSRGVIHRDIKPANIILDKQGHAILADFGLALLADIGTRGEIFGTPHYIAPEQAMSSAAAVSQSDLYSVGVMLYEMCTGEVPFDAPEALDIAMLHMSEPPTPPRKLEPGISPELEAVILKTLAKEPEDRYPTGAALIDSLDEALKSKRKTPSHVLDSRLSIPQRVAIDLAEHPLPPIPAGLPKPAPSPAEPAPAPPELPAEDKKTKVMPVSAPAARPDDASKNKRLLIYAGLGFGIILVIGIILLTLGTGLFFMLRDGGDEEGTGVAQTVKPEGTPTVAEAEILIAESSSTPPDSQVNETATALPLPTPTPTPGPQLLIDSYSDFSDFQGNWQYLWSPPKEDNWAGMKYEDRKYGACWYADVKEDYVRICPDSAHPGKKANIAWLWASEVSGPIELQISASKIDKKGDGVEIFVYHNATAKFKQSLKGKDTEGFVEKLQLDDIVPGDYLLFVISSKKKDEHDHTAFRAQICHYNCPMNFDYDGDNDDD